MRVVSLSPALTETLVMLGAGDELVGVSAYCRPYAPGGAVVVGGYTTVSTRRLEALSPGLVLLQGPAQEPLARLLVGRGFRVALLPLPASLWGVAENAAAVGGLVGRRAEGLELAGRLAGEVRALEETAPRPPVRVHAEIVWPLFRDRMSPGALSYADHVLRLAGALNTYSGEARAFVEVEPGDVERHDPEAIVVSAEAHMRLTPAAYLAHTPWARGLRAAREGRILVLDGSPGRDLAHPGPSAVETARFLRRSLHLLLSGPRGAAGVGGGGGEG